MLTVILCYPRWQCRCPFTCLRWTKNRQNTINRDYITDLIANRPDFYGDKSSLNGLSSRVELLDIPHPYVLEGEGIKNVKDVSLLVAEKLVAPSDRALVGHLGTDVEVVTTGRFVCQESSVA